MYANFNSANLGMHVDQDQRGKEKWKQLCESRGLGD